MALVSDLTEDQSKIDLLEKSIKIRDRYGTPRMDRKDVVWRKRNYKDFEIESQMEPAALLWDVQSDATRALWDVAGAACGLTGYQLFLQDTGFRLLNGLPGIIVPKTSHQFKVLELITGQIDQDWFLWQPHYNWYQLQQQQFGKKNAKQWVAFAEDLISPVTVSFNYNSDMKYLGGLEEFGVYIYIEGETSHGYDDDTFDFPLPLVTNWTHFEEEISHEFELVYYYDVTFYGFGAAGTLLIDNFKIEYSGQNWAFDSKCEQVDQRIFDIGDGPDYPWWTWFTTSLESLDSLYLE